MEEISFVSSEKEAVKNDEQVQKKIKVNYINWEEMQEEEIHESLILGKIQNEVKDKASNT